jgi:hypothetical protein
MAMTYADAVKSALPKQERVQGTAERLGKIEADTPEAATPEPDESLADWLNRAADEAKGAIKLRLVVGQSRGTHRREPDDKYTEPMMIRAATSDGASGAELLLGLLRQTSVDLKRIDFKSLVDERSETPDEIGDSHLIVVGTGEVNIVAAYLHGLATDLFFGAPHSQFDISQNRDKIIYVNKEINNPISRVPSGSEGTNVTREINNPISRVPSGSEGTNHGGAILLLKNPWNVRKRLLWVAGMSGCATSGGCRLIMSPSEEYRRNAATAVGVVYKTNYSMTEHELIAWLRRQDDRPVWQPGQDDPAPTVTKSKSLNEYIPESRTLVWDERVYTFTPSQGHCIQVLYNYYLRDLPITQVDLLEKAELEPDSKLKDVFKGSDAWQTVVVRGEKKGTYRLKKPSSC